MPLVVRWGATQELLGYANPKSLDPRRKNKRKKIKYMLFIIWMVILVLGSILNIGYTFTSSPY